MQPLQRMWDTQGNEVCLFPLQDLHMSQSEHQLYAIDFLGWDNGLRIFNCPCYAPISCRVVYTGNDHNMICWSISPVRLVDGTLSDISILVAHSMTAPASVGSTFVQGQLWYHTGNYGHSTGDHLHMEVALGHVRWDSSGTHLASPAHMWNVMAVNDTVVSNGMGLNWRNYDGGITPPTPTDEDKKKNFPWVLYSRKFRDNRANV